MRSKETWIGYIKH